MCTELLFDEEDVLYRRTDGELIEARKRETARPHPIASGRSRQVDAATP